MSITEKRRSWQGYGLIVLAALLVYMLLWLIWGGGATYFGKLAKLTPAELVLYAQLQSSRLPQESLYDATLDASSPLHDSTDSEVSSNWEVKIKLYGGQQGCNLGVELAPLASGVFFETTVALSEPMLLSGEYNSYNSYARAYFHGYNVTSDEGMRNAFRDLDEELSTKALCPGYSCSTNFLILHSALLQTEDERRNLAYWLNSPITVRISYRTGWRRTSEYLLCRVEIDDAARQWLLQMGVPLDMPIYQAKNLLPHP